MIRFSWFFLVLFFGACQSSSPSTPISPTPVATSKSLSVNTNKHSKPTCKISGEILDHNQLWLPNHSLMVCISADSTTKDTTFGDSHRILSLYNTVHCQQALQLVLPINRSPDFPYYLADRNYNNNSDIIAIKGIDHFYCLDLNSKKLLPPLRPVFKTPRLAVDAQSNQIQRLEVWEEFIIGYAQDQGVFVFQIDTSNVLSAILPYIEYKVRENVYHSLFLLDSGDKTQAIIPTYNWEEDRFEINPLFKQPIALQKEEVSRKQNLSHLILREKDSDLGMAINLINHQLVALPIEIQKKQNKDIEAYLSRSK